VRLRGSANGGGTGQRAKMRAGSVRCECERVGMQWKCDGRLQLACPRQGRTVSQTVRICRTTNDMNNQNRNANMEQMIHACHGWGKIQKDVKMIRGEEEK
jgi:hypothetical protein